MGGVGARLGTFDVRYKLRNSIKRQVMADFVVEFTPLTRASLLVCQVTVRRWKLYVNRASNVRGLGVGIILELPEGVRLKKYHRLGFQASNN